MLKIDNITEEVEKKIEKLKSIMDHELTWSLREDYSLYYRFLKARDFNIKHAEALLRKHLSDRKVYLDDIIKDYKPPEYMEKYIPLSFIGFDKEGCGIRYLDLGRSDPKALLTLFTLTEIIQYGGILLERDFKLMEQQSIKLGRSITKLTVIINMDELSLFQATFKKGIEAIIKIIELFQDNYPERVKALFFINASLYFPIGYSIIKGFLSNVLASKIHIFGRNGWQEVMLEHIDADVLPAFLGGNRTDPDGNPMCPSLINFGQKIPEELYAQKKNSIIRENGVKKLNITRFSSSEIMLYVYEEGTSIEWEFETKNKDIGFGLYYKDTSKENPKIEELIPKQRIDTLLSSEAGLYKCNKIGTYIILFDNSYSWIYSKELYYRIRLIKPNVIKTYTN